MLVKHTLKLIYYVHQVTPSGNPDMHFGFIRLETVPWQVIVNSRETRRFGKEQVMNFSIYGHSIFLIFLGRERHAISTAAMDWFIIVIKSSLRTTCCTSSTKMQHNLIHVWPFVWLQLIHKNGFIIHKTIRNNHWTFSEVNMPSESHTLCSVK